METKEKLTEAKLTQLVKEKLIDKSPKFQVESYESKKMMKPIKCHAMLK